MCFWRLHLRLLPVRPCSVSAVDGDVFHDRSVTTAAVVRPAMMELRWSSLEIKLGSMGGDGKDLVI